MANANREVISKTANETLPIVELLLNDECDSHHLINIVEIPTYLCFATNPTFEKMFQEKIHAARSCISMEALGQITILLHQLNIIDLEKSLWTMYCKSGTAKLLHSNLKLWPTAVKSMIQSSSYITTINDDIYWTFVNERLSELNSKQQEIQQQLVQNKKLFYGYTNTTEEILQTFIQQHLQCLRLLYDYKIKFVELNYQEHVFDEKLLQQKHVIQPLLDRKYDLEKAKQEVLSIKQQVQHQKLPKVFDPIQIPLPPSINSLTDRNLREQLEDRHHQIMKQYWSKMMHIYTETLEIKLQEAQKLFDEELTKFWRNQRLLPVQQRLKQTMIDLMEEHLTLITNKTQCIYNYKILQQLHPQVPTINQ